MNPVFESRLKIESLFYSLLNEVYRENGLSKNFKRFEEFTETCLNNCRKKYCDEVDIMTFIHLDLSYSDLALLRKTLLSYLPNIEKYLTESDSAGFKKFILVFNQYLNSDYYYYRFLIVIISIFSELQQLLITEGTDAEIKLLNLMYERKFYILNKEIDNQAIKDFYDSLYYTTGEKNCEDVKEKFIKIIDSVFYYLHIKSSIPSMTSIRSFFQTEFEREKQMINKMKTVIKETGLKFEKISIELRNIIDTLEIFALQDVTTFSPLIYSDTNIDNSSLSITEEEYLTKQIVKVSVDPTSLHEIEEAYRNLLNTPNIQKQNPRESIIIDKNFNSSESSTNKLIITPSSTETNNMPKKTLHNSYAQAEKIVIEDSRDIEGSLEKITITPIPDQICYSSTSYKSITTDGHEFIIETEPIVMTESQINKTEKEKQEAIKIQIDQDVSRIADKLMENLAIVSQEQLNKINARFKNKTKDDKKLKKEPNDNNRKENNKVSDNQTNKDPQTIFGF